MNCESWLEPKNSLMAASTGRAFMRSWGTISSMSWTAIRSLYGSLHAHQTDAELVLQQLADGLDPSVAEVVDVVGLALSGVDPDQPAEGLDNVFPA